MKLILRRTSSGPDGVFGQLYIPGFDTLWTCEDDWLQNAKGKSCIPAGTYELQRTTYHKHGFDTFEVMDVPGRERILLHPGNTEEDTAGCILVGLKRGTLLVKDEDDPTGAMVEKQSVVYSKEAFRRLMVRLAGVETAQLTVEWASGLPPIMAKAA